MIACTRIQDVQASSCEPSTTPPHSRLGNSHGSNPWRVVDDRGAGDRVLILQLVIAVLGFSALVLIRFVRHLL
jgi:hypothetical protein